MASSRQILTLGDLGPIKTGKTPSTKVPEHFGGKIPFVTPRDMDGRKRIVGTERYLTEKGARAVGSAVIPAGSIMVSCIGSDMGKVAIADRECVTNQQINSIVVAEEYASEYVYYDLSQRKSELRSMASGSAQPILNKGHFSQVAIEIPDFPEQRAIAHILGSLDDKIELNRRMNQTLESTTRAIFKSWFVDFDPVRAKSEGRPTGLPDDIAALFPDSFEDSELGEIPKGWNPSTIGAEFNLTMGQSPPGKTYNETGNGLPFFQGCRDFGFRYPSNRVYCTAPQRLADQGDTLVSVRAPVGDINMAMERCCVGRGIAGIRHKSGSRSYTYYAMHTLSDRFARFEAEGTVFGAINKKQFERLRWLYFGENLVVEFEKIAFAIDEQIEKNTIESETLTTLRDTLLPKLITGELRIPDAEKFVEETGV
ncbi:MAG: restriction endonuclease subunit S [Deltaproteobacteria bacterium]|nr:restriction endonuclease subunit S [Deltaproteobacteria bacterium]